MYEGFERFEIQTSDPEVRIVGRGGGRGPAVLLTVVATDLRGYGDSGKPRGKADRSNYSFRRMAQDQVEVMHSAEAITDLTVSLQGSWSGRLSTRPALRSANSSLRHRPV